MNTKSPQVDEFLSKTKKWKSELERLRAIALECGLTEELKWRQPCYTYQGSNVVILGGFKEYCSLMFFKGALLKDPEGILIQQTENVQAGRQLRFTNVKEIEDQKATIKAYIFEAIEVEKAGLKVPMKKTSAYKMPDELKNRLEADPDLKEAFESLTPGRQRGYILFFSSAKQAKTREARIDKYIPRIMEGKGYQDR